MFRTSSFVTFREVKPLLTISPKTELSTPRSATRDTLERREEPFTRLFQLPSTFECRQIHILLAKLVYKPRNKQRSLSSRAKPSQDSQDSSHQSRMMSLKQNPRVRRTAESLFMRGALLFIIDSQPRDARMFTRLGDRVVWFSGVRTAFLWRALDSATIIHLRTHTHSEWSKKNPISSRTRRLTLAFFRHNFIRYTLTKRCRIRRTMDFKSSRVPWLI